MLLYLAATFGMLAVLPADEIHVDTGILEALRQAFAGFRHGSVLVLVLGALLVLTLFTNMATWGMGINRAMGEAAASGWMPRALGVLQARWGTPVGANLWTAGLSTGALLLYSLAAQTAEELFWTLLSFSTFIFLIPYLVMFCAFVRLRRSEPDWRRPYRVPGGVAGSLVAAGFCIGFVGLAMLLFAYTPGSDFDVRHTSSVLGGAIAAIAAGELLLRRRADDALRA